MTLRQWAGELRPLSRSALLLFSARCAMRVEPWIPEGAAASWADNLAFLVGTAFPSCQGKLGTAQTSRGFAPSRFGGPPDAVELASRRRAISSWGATACNRLAATDGPLGQCMSYATSTLATALGAAAAADRPTVLKRTIDVAKLSAAIAAVWAHAGRVAAGADGTDAVTLACTTTWAEIRRDIAPLAALAPSLEASEGRVEALRELAPLWTGVAPSWATPPRVSTSEMEGRLVRVFSLCDGLVERRRLEEDRSLTTAGEPGVALENLCDQLLDQDAVVPVEVVDEIAALGRAMGLNERYWLRLPRR